MEIKSNSKWGVANNMRTLQVQGETTKNELKFKLQGIRGEVSVFKDYQKAGDGILWGMQHGTMIKGQYSEADLKHSERMRNEISIKNGEVVLIAGKQYKVRILGNYSDCAIFDPMEVK